MQALVLASLVSLGSPSSTPPAAPTRAAAPSQESSPGRARLRPRPPRDRWSWRFVGIHYGTGVMTSLLVLPGSYGLAGWIGHQGRGLGPVVGAMLVGAFVPPVVTYTVQWAVARRFYPRRERYWPGWLSHQVGHLAVFAGAVLGGADLRVIGDAAPVVLTDALVVTGLGSLTAEATRRPARPSASPELSWQRHQRLWAPPRFEVIVPVLEIPLP